MPPRWHYDDRGTRCRSRRSDRPAAWRRGRDRGRHHLGGRRRGPGLPRPARHAHVGCDRGGKGLARAAREFAVIELYAITNTPAPHAAGLRAIERDGLAAICSPADDQQKVSAEELWRREEVLESLMHECDVLPVRYGTVVSDDDEAEQLLADRHAELLLALERVRGAVELAVRVAGDDRAAPRDAGAYIRVKTRLLE